MTIGLAVCLSSTVALADPPPDYYDDVDTSSPEALRESLHETIDDHQRESTLSNCAWDTVQTDVTPPAKVTTLDASTGSWQGQLKVVWEAVADDSNFVDSGRATEYDLRYSKSGQIDTANWESATQWPNVPSPPAEPGARDSVEILSLDFDEVYYVALKVRDKVGNWSVISNCDWAPSGAAGRSQVVSAASRPSFSTSRVWLASSAFCLHPWSPFRPSLRCSKDESSICRRSSSPRRG